MNWLFDLLLIVVLIILLTIWIIYLRKRLLELWKEVTTQEVAFYRQLERVLKEFYEHLDHLTTEDNREFVRMIRRYRKKRVRSLLLHTRQELYNAMNIVYDQVLEREDHEECKKLIEQYDKLQKIRRVYNSKVLIYNQTISVFPTRYLALRMKLELKEYFG